ncbi:MAG: hypothetical protein R3C15_17030 [Thermoleophilia bacterium]
MRTITRIGLAVASLAAALALSLPGKAAAKSCIVATTTAKKGGGYATTLKLVRRASCAKGSIDAAKVTGPAGPQGATGPQGAPGP